MHLRNDTCVIMHQQISMHASSAVTSAWEITSSTLSSSFPCSADSSDGPLGPFVIPDVELEAAVVQDRTQFLVKVSNCVKLPTSYDRSGHQSMGR